MSTSTVTPNAPVTPDQYVPMDAKISALARLLSGFQAQGGISQPSTLVTPQSSPVLAGKTEDGYGLHAAGNSTPQDTPAPGAASQPAPAVTPAQPTAPTQSVTSAAGMEAAALGPSYSYKVDDPRSQQAEEAFKNQAPSIYGVPQAPNALPAAPAAPDLSPEEARAHAYEATLAGRAPSPSDPESKPKWYDRLFGAMTTFGAAYQHNPNAMQLGQEIVGRRYNNAMTDFQHNQDAARTGLAGVNAEIGEKTRDYGLQRQNWNDQIELGREGRANTTADALNTQRIATAGFKDYKSMDPAARVKELPGLNKQLGTAGITLSDDEQKQFVMNGDLPKPAQKRVAGETVQANLFSDDPAVKAEAERYFRMEHPADSPSGPSTPQQKPMTPGQKLQVNTTKDKAFKAAQQDLNTDLRNASNNKNISADEKQKHVSAAMEKFLDATQTAQNNFEVANGTDPQGPNHYDVRAHWNPDTKKFDDAPQKAESTNAPSGKGRQLDRDTASSILKEAGGDKAKARTLATQRGYKF